MIDLKVVKRLYKLIRGTFSLQDIKCSIGITLKEISTIISIILTIVIISIIITKSSNNKNKIVIKLKWLLK